VWFAVATIWTNPIRNPVPERSERGFFFVTYGLLAQLEEASTSKVEQVWVRIPESPPQPNMAIYRNGHGTVCKAAISRFDSGGRLHIPR
jgi:hypothetical protein